MSDWDPCMPVKLLYGTRLTLDWPAVLYFCSDVWSTGIPVGVEWGSWCLVLWMMSLRRMSSFPAMSPETGHAVGSERPSGGAAGTTLVVHGAARRGQPKRGRCTLQGQPVGLPGKRRFAHYNTLTFVFPCTLPFLFRFDFCICIALNHRYSLKGVNRPYAWPDLIDWCVFPQSTLSVMEKIRCGPITGGTTKEAYPNRQPARPALQVFNKVWICH